MDTSPLAAVKHSVASGENTSTETHKPSLGNKKRKRQDDNKISNPFFRPFAATLHPQTTSKSHTFVPIAHLPRADLPLLWLDYGTKKTTIQPGALLQASLEQVHRDALREHASMLVARLTPNGGLYAIERAGDDLHVACGLQSWVSESRVIGQGLGTKCDVNDLQCLLDHRTQIAASETNAVPLKPRTPKKPKDRRGAVARMSILPAKETDAATDPQSHNRPPEATAAAQSPSGQVVIGELPASATFKEGLDALSGPQTALLDVDHLRAQYLETLYLSKTSLAYLAKGPLARARNLAQSEDGEAARIKLLDFYRESIISNKKLDLKYKESVNMVVESARSSHRADEPSRQQNGLVSGGKAGGKRNRKKKMGKDGLYPAEEGYIQRCWAEREVRNPGTLSADSQAQEQRKFVSDLRTRETKMQVLLVLEVLTLEGLSATCKDSASVSGSVVKTEELDVEVATVFAKTPIKAKHKPIVSTSDIDTLVDRLCIWHAVGIDDMLDTPGKDTKETQTHSATTKDQLRDFCADVIIPFYASRLPGQCKSICQKLGGPEVSPKRSKPTLSKSASTSRLPPGAPIKQRPRTMPKKTLERVLSDDRGMRHASPPTFSRSSTAPLISNLKREPFESSQRPASRGALHKTVSFSNREIDLDADARYQDARRRKLVRVAEQKKELDAAIAALKKPNRTVASRGFMDEIESRNSDAHGRKQQIHITATPKRPKSRGSSYHELSLQPTLKLDAASEDPVVPSSTARPQVSAVRPIFPQSSAEKPAVLFAIHETPARPTSAPQEMEPRAISQLNLSTNWSSISMSSDPTLVESTPATNRLRPDLLTQVENTPMRMSKSMRPVLFTPLKKTDVRVEDAFRDAPIIPADAGKAMDQVMGGGTSAEMSVYDALGWNDDYDL